MFLKIVFANNFFYLQNELALCSSEKRENSNFDFSCNSQSWDDQIVYHWEEE